MSARSQNKKDSKTAAKQIFLLGLPYLMAFLGILCLSVCLSVIIREKLENSFLMALFNAPELSDTDTEKKTPIVIPDGQLSLDNFPKLAWGDQFATLSVDELPDATINGAPVFVGDDNGILKKGVGKYYGSDFCGEGGKIVLSAHCNKAFYCLEDMQPGYTVRMHTVYGEYAYKVSDIFLFNIDDNHVVLDKTDSEQLLLYTCYPRGLGFRRQRLAVVCKKVSGADFK